jgi:hypothetical protein
MNLPINYQEAGPCTRRAARNEYVRIQAGLCYHCKEPLTGDPSKDVMRKRIRLGLFPKGFLTWPIHLHHDHNTGITLGAVHARCNAVLWQYHGE